MGCGFKPTFHICLMRCVWNSVLQDKKEIGAPGKYSAADRGLNIFQITLNVESISTTVILNCERKMPKFKFEKKNQNTENNEVWTLFLATTSSNSDVSLFK